MAEIFNEERFNNDVLKKSGIALIDFYADWCGPCKMMAPIIDEVSSEYGEAVTVGKIDVDSERGLAQKYGVMSIPTMIIFKNGQPVDKIIGAVSKSELKATVDKNM